MNQSDCLLSERKPSHRITTSHLKLPNQSPKFASAEQAKPFALKLPLKPEIAPDTEEALDGLTRREREIAALIGLGKTNGEIASELVISKRTAETRVGKILSKLGLSSRSQVIHWTLNHRLT